MERKRITIGSRGSQLALIQTEYVKSLLLEKYPDITFEIEVIKTKGDKILDVALSKIGDKGLFTKELEVALVEKTIDFAVHSLKDIPTKLPEGLVVGAICKRHDVPLWEALSHHFGRLVTVSLSMRSISTALWPHYLQVSPTDAKRTQGR